MMIQSFISWVFGLLTVPIGVMMGATAVVVYAIVLSNLLKNLFNQGE